MKRKMVELVRRRVEQTPSIRTTANGRTAVERSMANGGGRWMVQQTREPGTTTEMNIYHNG